MVGAIIVTHASLGKELIAATEYIVGKVECIEAVSIQSESNSFEARKTIMEEMKKVNQGKGILLLTDLPGGSAGNIAFSFLTQEKVEVITGVNLPMVLTFRNKRETHTLQEVAEAVHLSGVRSINRAKTLTDIKSDGRRALSREKELSLQKQ